MATNPPLTKPTSPPSSPLVTAGLAVLYIAVFDAVFETFLSGSPVRWWVVGVVATYLALSVGLWQYRRPLWQRMGSSASWSGTFFLLLGLLAFTAWLPGGLTEGIRAVGQSTSRVLMLFTTVTIVLAGVSLVRLSWLPRWAKWVTGALTAYGVVGFLEGIISGTSYPELLHGQSFWSWLPWWLQGAFVGTLILLLSIFSQIVTHAQQMTSVSLRKWKLQPLALAMALVIAAAGLRAPSGLGRYQIQLGDLGARLGPVFFAASKFASRPVGRADRFKEGVRAVYAFFNTEGLRGDEVVGIVWYKGADRLVAQRAKVSELLGAIGGKNGFVWFAHEFDKGAPPGGYFVEISINDSPAVDASFEVDPK